MSITAVLHSKASHQAIPARDVLNRVSAWWRGLSLRSIKTATCDTREAAATLYARAADYESTQPSFAADLRAAAEAMDHLATKSAR
jgi:hypothetical protein